MSDPADSAEFMAAVSAILRAAAMTAKAEDGNPTDEATALEIDLAAIGMIEAGLAFMSALSETGKPWRRRMAGRPRRPCRRLSLSGREPPKRSTRNSA